MTRSWMPTVVCILNVAVGVFGVVTGPIMVVLAFFIPVAQESPRITALFIGIGILLAISGAIAIIGGAYALQRKRWGIALAGSIAAFIPSRLFGIVSIILTVLSKSEFKQSDSINNCQR